MIHPKKIVRHYVEVSLVDDAKRLYRQRTRLGRITHLLIRFGQVLQSSHLVLGISALSCAFKCIFITADSGLELSQPGVSIPNVRLGDEDLIAKPAVRSKLNGLRRIRGLRAWR
jgi:hypothetical protein